MVLSLPASSGTDRLRGAAGQHPVRRVGLRRHDRVVARRAATTFVVVTGNLTQLGASAGNNNTQKMILGGIDGR